MPAEVARKSFCRLPQILHHCLSFHSRGILLKQIEELFAHDLSTKNKLDENEQNNTGWGSKLSWCAFKTSSTEIFSWASLYSALACKSRLIFGRSALKLCFIIIATNLMINLQRNWSGAKKNTFCHLLRELPGLLLRHPIHICPIPSSKRFSIIFP